MCDQLLDRRFVFHPDGVDAGDDPVDADQWNLPGGDRRHDVAGIGGRREDDSGGALAEQIADGPFFAVRIVVGVGQQQRVVLLGEQFLDGMDDISEIRVGDRGHRQADGAGRPGAHRPGDTVVDVPGVGHGLADRRAVLALTFRVLLSTCETVAVDTPAFCATSRIVTMPPSPFRAPPASLR